MIVQTTGIEPQMRRIAILITTFALAMAGLVFSPANAATITVPCTGGGYVDIVDNVVDFGRDCVGAVVIPSGVTRIGDSAFQFASSLTSITIPASVTTIEDWAFRDTSSLTTVTFESDSQLTRIGNYAFRSLNGNVLTNLTIPARVTSIGQQAFRGQDALTSVTIPASVTSIGNDAFWATTSLTSVYFLGNAPANVGTTPFLSGASGAKAYIKSGATGFGSAGADWNGLIVEVGVYTVSYNTNGGSNISAQGFRGNIAEPSVPTRTGYTFAGWSATDGGSVITFPYTPDSVSDITIYAKWTANTNTVTYNSASGTAINPGSFTTGGTIQTAPVSTRTGYTFVGWSATDGGSAVTFPYSPSATSSITLYAIWTRNLVKAVVSTKPTITGKATATTKGTNKLTAKKGTWTGYPTPVISYQWYSCTSQVKSATSTIPKSCKKISKATKSTLAVTNAFKGKFIAVAVTGKGTGTTATTWLSKSTAKVK